MNIERQSIQSAVNGIRAVGVLLNAPQLVLTAIRLPLQNIRASSKASAFYIEQPT